jgi:hypothetical protein
MSELDGETPLVSFVVPTLNRGKYVVRAVNSCLLAGARASVPVEVVIIDSVSDDGSWEELKARFSDDARVQLLQNDRTIGPTGSWLLGARMARGLFATFVWSDDYLTPDFLVKLLPKLESAERLTIGLGVVRDVDNEESLDSASQPAVIDSGTLLAAYLSGEASTTFLTPVSPACALFHIAAFRDWCSGIESLSRASHLRHRLMWRAAIGPDVLLFLWALKQQTETVGQELSPVAQFSSHSSSITMASDPWLLRAGYWLARSAACQQGFGRRLPQEQQANIISRLLGVGLLLAATVPQQPASGLTRRAARAALVAECGALAKHATRAVGTASTVRSFLRLAVARARVGGRHSWK